MNGQTSQPTLPSFAVPFTPTHYGDTSRNGTLMQSGHSHFDLGNPLDRAKAAIQVQIQDVQAQEAALQLMMRRRHLENELARLEKSRPVAEPGGLSSSGAASWRCQQSGLSGMPNTWQSLPNSQGAHHSFGPHPYIPYSQSHHPPTGQPPQPDSSTQYGWPNSPPQFATAAQAIHMPNAVGHSQTTPGVRNDTSRASEIQIRDTQVLNSADPPGPNKPGVWDFYGVGGTAKRPTEPPGKRYLRCKDRNCSKVTKHWTSYQAFTTHLREDHDNMRPRTWEQKKQTPNLSNIYHLLKTYGVLVSDIEKYEAEFGPDHKISNNRASTTTVIDLESPSALPANTSQPGGLQSGQEAYPRQAGQQGPGYLPSPPPHHSATPCARQNRPPPTGSEVTLTGLPSTTVAEGRTAVRVADLPEPETQWQPPRGSATGGRPFQCHWGDCGTVWLRMDDLETHLRTHTAVKPFQRDQGCEKTSPTKQGRQAHERADAPVKPFSHQPKLQCDICKKLCKSHPDLKNHWQVHTGEMRFQCPCGRPFKQRCNMIRHQNRESHGRRYDSGHSASQSQT